MNFLRETAEFTIVIFVAGHLSTLTNWAFKRSRLWWKEREWRKDIAWLEESNKRNTPRVCRKCGHVYTVSVSTEWCEDCLDSGN